MSMANRVFELQSSRFMIVLQLLIFISLAVLLYHVLPLGIWLLCLGIMAIVWFRFLQQPQVRRFEHLHGQDWSFEFVNSDFPVQRWQIVKMIDHHCYIVLYFSSSQNKKCIIWWDQLPVTQWKNLKLLIKML
ncbi:MULTISPECIES: protein YgfX [Acinetobacter]|uniref:Uncharacterized protein n=1 Tax=Acinetobacter parvus DSM 16617 = CIP 108168 TaxID=981333 RepID=N8Q9Y3_9GAMM|nr:MULTISPECIES: protein YgfX [Acinetobacter]ENU35370.1 hypothetical protein F988_02445 [Acinetobacter parvus DSM 16617 = CIP 108168]ENU83517.1 hypothetical protein F974_01422 [Acinetobacter sp. CIP 102159]ENU88250.1 hypothetical protein F972_02367 [Acinetobacter sp. CIP 102529]ENU95678.1 hypothetical protein F970_01616 [Acinetobacter sp. CIP 102082]MCU4393480.1 hypothetical protein [Acinetobacter parvus]